MHPRRTRFKREIVSEFFAPDKRSSKVIILCSGMPGYPSNRRLLSYLSKKGYWAFQPRYRGTWESDGRFLARSPHYDILDIISELPKGFVDQWSGTKHRIHNPEVYVIGVSFGGPAAILASLDGKVKRVVAIAPVIDWTKESKVEPIDFMVKFIKGGFGNAYRVAKNDWKKLKSGTFYNPMAIAKKVDSKKLLIIHAKDDKVVLVGPTQKFAKATGALLVILKKGGHLSSSMLMEGAFWKIVKPFLAKGRSVS